MFMLDLRDDDIERLLQLGSAVGATMASQEGQWPHLQIEEWVSSFLRTAGAASMAHARQPSMRCFDRDANRLDRQRTRRPY